MIRATPSPLYRNGRAPNHNAINEKVPLSDCFYLYYQFLPIMMWALFSFHYPQKVESLQIYRKAPGLVEQEIEGETVILDKEAGLIHQLNPTASEIWRACDGQLTADDIAKQIADRYGIEVKLARADVESTLQQLEQKMLVQLV